MRTQLAADGYRFGSLVETIVTSPQFLNKRGDGDRARQTTMSQPIESTRPSAPRLAVARSSAAPA